MPPAASSRWLSVLTTLALQTALWLALALALAVLLVVAGSLPWADAYAISALNCLPWAVLAPGVFWLSQRCPLLPGQLWRSVPVHLTACVGCVVLALGLAVQVVPLALPRPMGERPDFRGAPPLGGPFHGPPGSKGGPLKKRPFAPPGEDGVRPTPAGSIDPRTQWRDGSRKAPAGEFGRGGARGGFGPYGRRDGFPGREGFPNRGPFGMMLPPFGWMMLRANFDLAFYFIVAAAAHAFAFYRRAQERDRHALELTASLNRAKLDALRLQLQPHFLFNTLNAIATLVHRDARAADELIGDLSDLLRLSLLTTDHEVPLARELELLDRYLAIEQARLGDRLRIRREIEPEATGALVPTFVLQPLAENAVRHGVEPRSAPGTITISARRDADTLRLTVADDGVGLATAQAAARRGIGLANTEARLQALHSADAKLELHTPPAGGLRVEITLPFKTAEAKPQIDTDEHKLSSRAGPDL